MAEFTSKWATWSPTLTTRSDRMELGDTIKLERVTLLIATQVYATGKAAKGATGLDNIMDVLNEHLDSDCKVLDYAVSEYKMIEAGDGDI